MTKDPLKAARDKALALLATSPEDAEEMLVEQIGLESAIRTVYRVHAQTNDVEAAATAGVDKIRQTIGAGSTTAPVPAGTVPDEMRTQLATALGMSPDTPLEQLIPKATTAAQVVKGVYEKCGMPTSGELITQSNVDMVVEQMRRATVPQPPANPPSSTSPTVPSMQTPPQGTPPQGTPPHGTPPPKTMSERLGHLRSAFGSGS
jgi:hypothetical protein